MIKKTVLQHRNFTKENNFTKVIIFDLSGVLLYKKSVEQLAQENNSKAPMIVVNFLEILSLVRACKLAGHKLFILSNMSLTTFERIKQEPEIASLFSFFDDIIISAMTPYEKPDTQIFTYFCEQYNLQPKDCIFIDDKQNNLEAAQSAHITKTILCSNFDLQHVRNELVAFGILHHQDALALHIPTGQA